MKLFPEIRWRFACSEKVIYLSFDDGPVPEATPYVLEQLELYHAKATFFCVGENAVKNPALLESILKAGHSSGNHTYNHLNGWKTDPGTYLENIEKCKAVVPSALFRPPYGKMTQAQYKEIRKTYKIVLWDVVSYDFDPDLPPEACLDAVKKHVKPGSVVVFHDSLKALENLRIALPGTLAYFSSLGYTFKPISEN